MSKFIGMTVGLECNHAKGGNVGKLVKIEYLAESDGTVTLRAISGRNLAPLIGFENISRAAFDARPPGDIEEARWALDRCGWTLMADDYRAA